MKDEDKINKNEPGGNRDNSVNISTNKDFLKNYYLLRNRKDNSFMKQEQEDIKMDQSENQRC